MQTEVKQELPAPLSGWLAKRASLCLLIPTLLALVIHLPALWSELIWDDEGLVLDHPKLGEPGFYREIFGRDYGLELAHRSPTGYYRPALMAVNIMVFKAFGKSAPAYHAAVLLTFCLAVFLLTKVTLAAVGNARSWLALSLGCVAAVHPVRTEFAVFFMSMPDVLLEVYAMLIIGISLEFFGPRSPGWRVALIGGLAFLGALTKETSFFVLGALGGCLLLISTSPRRGRSDLFAGLAVLFGLAAGLVCRIGAGVGQPTGAEPWASLPAGSGRALGGLLLGLRDLLIPANAVFMRWNDSPPTITTMLACVAVILAGAALVLWLVRRDRWFPALIASWIFGGVISLMLIRANDLPYADRYVPSAALIIGLGLLFDRFWRRTYHASQFRRRIAPVLVVGYVSLLAVFGWLSTEQCVNGLAFFRTLAEDEPGLAYPRVMLANIWFYRYGDFARMEQNVREAVAISPDVPGVRRLGILLAKRCVLEKRYAQGLSALEWTAQVLPNDDEVWSLRATCHGGLRQFPQARAAVERAVQLRPEYAPYQRQRERLATQANDGG